MRTDAYRGKNGYWFLMESSIFIQEKFIASCLKKDLFSKAPLDWCLGNLFFVVTRLFSYLLLTNKSQLSTIKYLLSYSKFIYICCCHCQPYLSINQTSIVDFTQWLMQK